jgi:hypothetical protein
MMKRVVVLMLAATAIVGCGGDKDPSDVTGPDPLLTGSLRVINAFTGPVDVLVDGNVAISNLAAASIGIASPASGSHTILLRPVGSSASAAQSVTTTTGAMKTIAAVRTSSGAVASTALDDTNSVVPSGATKLRVLHLAPNAGTLQVYRIQPDFQTPVSWQFPFTYQAEPTSLSAPFYQSGIGAWEVRVWQAPTDPSGWNTATVKAIVTLGGGEKKTVVILDVPGGGVRVEVL